ncbi:hypothetical protein B0T22DRAFT_462549 [Podospora appendiculata]|uniref:Wax synthase domain-containing protein n=1 Tax=Podospora appendiculata TaxID=314037 RepID=A0AAE0XC42_9PEZI|nr:hypothetical protein B0T22DRAFT_474421 [Podospora appendiculata]KAK3689931.1 hypothetical protein B0T22DRAFT_462549 [Podospora appendiculata]
MIVGARSLCYLLVVSVSTLGQAQSNNTTTPATTSWRSEPNGRGTFSLIFSCIATLTLCVWSALHLNVPPAHRPLQRRFRDKAKWVLYGIFAPELVVATAAAQFIVARWLKAEIERDAKHRPREGNDLGLSSHTWDTTQCFYAVMGGFTVDTPWIDARHGGGGDVRRRRVTVTPEGIRLLSFLGRLPHIQESQIEDKSKADWTAKSIICIQAGWMVVQIIGRVIKGMPVSLLEINTCGHVVCALVIYLLWWNKPLDVEVPTLLSDEDNDILALMYLCSGTSAANGITHIRCFIHVGSEGEEDLSRPSGDGSKTEKTEDRSQLTTYLSIGSPGSRNPSRFLGFNEVWTAPTPVDPTAEETKKNTLSSRTFKYNFDLTTPVIAPECLVYYSPLYPPGISLRHSKYCRRAFPDAQAGIDAHTPVPPAVLASASKVADALRSECLSRPRYKPYYFTSVPELGSFLGETDYIVPHMVNFPSLHNLGLGQVNIHRDTLRSVLALTAAAYGALHCAGWVEPFFPTPLERVLWIASAVTIASSGALLWAFFSARQLWPAFDKWVSGVTPGVHITSVRTQNKWVMRPKLGAIYSVLAVFALARVFLVVEAFISLRDAPVALYDTPDWTDFLPHL